MNQAIKNEKYTFYISLSLSLEWVNIASCGDFPVLLVDWKSGYGPTSIKMRDFFLLLLVLLLLNATILEGIHKWRHRATCASSTAQSKLKIGKITILNKVKMPFIRSSGIQGI